MYWFSLVVDWSSVNWLRDQSSLYCVICISWLYTYSCLFWLRQGHGWKLNRTSYYQEGWLAAGNVKSVVGVTFTSTLPHRTVPTASSSVDISGAATLPPHLPLPPRTNYNLRGHRAQVSVDQRLLLLIHIFNRCVEYIFFSRLALSGGMNRTRSWPLATHLVSSSCGSVTRVDGPSNS